MKGNVKNTGEIEVKEEDKGRNGTEAERNNRKERKGGRKKRKNLN